MSRCRYCNGEGWEPVAWWERIRTRDGGGVYIERQPMDVSTSAAARPTGDWLPYTGVVKCRCRGGTAAERYQREVEELRQRSAFAD